MSKFILVMLLCSNVSGNDCRPFEPEYIEFKTFHGCARYGYQYASELMTNFSDEFIDEYRTHIVFLCKENQTI